MAVNKLALIRYKAINDCLRNRRRKWTLEDLIDKVSEILYELEGIENGVSKRTIQADIQLMRSDKLGYNAPIVIRDKKYYTYEDADYSITTSPMNDADMEKLREVVGLLKAFSGFAYLDEMSVLVAKLENNLNQSATHGQSCIQFENNTQLKGLEHINPLYQAVFGQKPLLIEYQSFKAAQPQMNIYYPYLLKEYRNRWFLLCRRKGSGSLLNLALDRMLSIRQILNEPFEAYTGIDFERYFSDLIGVTKSEKDRPHKVILQINKANAPYVLTKPLHPSQQVLKEDENGVMIRIDVILNFELEREILGFGEFMKVLAPRFLASRLRKRMKESLNNYEPKQVPLQHEPETEN